ncbi:MAG: DUF4292 domain-containing protein [Melioribacteraceae bacterium]|nr:DUF4292 domain-containing protein [Melioribacteraceae bacterium]MCF8355508.1 DUF4292 domain-containing protein [Melioribacteraceae bacterium]MCF8394196.1 DUF4292 domain-containing protein [Melioribacteraceae bacterium]MCF8419916.1 DUF4292 domain-containing protein [Melioribacteraceae bacterium]
MKKVIISLALLFFLISLISCVPSKPVSEEQILPADRLIKKLEANRRKIKTFKGNGVLSIDSPAFSGKGSFEVLLKKPDTIKVAIYGPFGIDLAQAIVTKNEFTFFDVMKNRAFQGTNKKGILKEIFKMDLEFDDLMDAFAGAVNLTDKLRNEPDIYNVDENEYELTYIDSLREKKSIYKVKVDGLALFGYQLKNFSDNILFEGEYREFRDFESVPVPYKSSITDKINSQSIEIDYRNIEVNQEIRKVTLILPTDVKIIKW